MTTYEEIMLIGTVVTGIGTPVSIVIGYINWRGNQIQQKGLEIQNEQTDEYRQQTDIMRAQAAGAPVSVPVRIHSVSPTVSVQLSWFQRHGSLPYAILAVILAIASTSLLYAFLHAPLESIHGTVEVAEGSEKVSIPVKAHPPYEVLATANWSTNIWPDKREDGKFSLSFNTDAPKNATVDWEVIPLPAESKVGQDKASEQLAARDQAVQTLQQQLRTLNDELNELKANEWPTLKPQTIETISQALKAVGPHQYVLWSCPSSDCSSFASGLRTAFAEAGWSLLPSPPPPNFYIDKGGPPPGWAIDGLDDDTGLHALHDVIKSTLGGEIPTNRYTAPKDMHYVEIRVGQKPFELQLTQIP